MKCRYVFTSMRAEPDKSPVIDQVTKMLNRAGGDVTPVGSPPGWWDSRQWHQAEIETSVRNAYPISLPSRWTINDCDLFMKWLTNGSILLFVHMVE